MVYPVSTKEKGPTEIPAAAVQIVELELMRTPSIARLKPGRRNAIAGKIVQGLSKAGMLDHPAKPSDAGDLAPDAKR